MEEGHREGGVKREREEAEQHSSSDDQPLAVVAKKKLDAKSPAAAAPAKPAVKKEAVEADDDDEDDVPLAVVVQKKQQEQAKKKDAPKTPASAPKPKKTKGADDDDDEFVKKGSQKRERQTPAKSKTPAKKETPSNGAKGGDDDDDDEDVPLGQIVEKKKATAAAAKKKVKKEVSSQASQESGKKGRKVKEEEDVWEWWNEPPLPPGKKWRTLSHNGVNFPEAYQPHGVKMLYAGKPITLNAEAEERATHYSRYLDTQHTKKDAFNKNFFAEFKAVANKGLKEPVVVKFEDCDFRPLKEYQDRLKEERKNRTKEQKAEEKAQKAALQEKFGWAVLDGHKQKLGNFTIEPPGLFLGRGAHPKTGTWKRRIMPEDVTINIGEEAKVPECPIPGHKWKGVVHNDEVTWLATWTEGVQGSNKYVQLASSSRTKGMSDMAKFDKARALGGRIDEIRRKYTADMKDGDTREQQRACVIYLIDKLALRVGGEKDTAKSADTVGCSSLRVEHVTLSPPCSLTLDFLGKDSMRYYSTVEVDAQVFKLLQKFVKGKDKTEQVFDEVNPSVVNEYLKQFMPGLSAKVFRTYNASITLERELLSTPKDATIEEKVNFYNQANKQVALLCNHKRTLPPKFADSMKVLDEKIASINKDITELKEHKKLLKAGKKPLARGKNEEGEDLPPLPTDPDKIDAQLEKLELRLKKEQLKKEDKESNAEVALGTSKQNYNDPRITAAWCKKYDVPWAKVMPAGLRAKFPWAQVADAEFKFSDFKAAEANQKKTKKTKTPTSSRKKKKDEESSEEEGDDDDDDDEE